MDIEPINVHGWKFEITNNQLVITSEQNPAEKVQLNAEAAFSLLDYLYRYRNNLAATTQSNERQSADLEQPT